VQLIGIDTLELSKGETGMGWQKPGLINLPANWQQPVGLIPRHLCAA